MNDEHYGAVGHPELEPGLYSVKGEQKRFFTREDIVKLFGDTWSLESIEEKQIDRYEHPKIIWEFVVING